jgi:hypothetical protein
MRFKAQLLQEKSCNLIACREGSSVVDVALLQIWVIIFDKLGPVGLEFGHGNL